MYFVLYFIVQCTRAAFVLRILIEYLLCSSIDINDYWSTISFGLDSIVLATLLEIITIVVLSTLLLMEIKTLMYSSFQRLFLLFWFFLFLVEWHFQVFVE